MDFKNVILSMVVAGGVVLTPALSHAERICTDLKKVDSFTTILDHSGSMYMKALLGKTKMQMAKTVLAEMVDVVPANLAYGTEMNLACADQRLYKGDFTPAAYKEALGKVKDDDAIFGRLTSLWTSLDKQVVAEHKGRAEAVILVTDGDWNRGKNPVDTVKALYEANPNVVVHIISFADTPNGEKTIKEIQALKAGSVVVDGERLYKDKAAVKEFVDKVFWGKACVTEVFFDLNKSVIRPDAAAVLDEIKTSGVLVNDVVIDGYACRLGTKAYNVKLSQRRADAVKEYLGATDAVAKGHGKNYKYKELPKNRRAEISFK